MRWGSVRAGKRWSDLYALFVALVGQSLYLVLGGLDEMAHRFCQRVGEGFV